MRRSGITIVATPMRKPPISRIRGVRLCSGIFTEREFPAIGIATSGGKNNEDGGDANDANDSEGEVGRGERGPGGDRRHCRLVVYWFIITPFSRKAKGG